MFSDFNWPEDADPFLNQRDVMKYLHDYQEHFGLNNYFRYNTEVINVSKADNNDSTWVIKYQEKGISEVKTANFDFVVVASGSNTNPFVPHFHGQENYTGQIVHSKSYRNAEPYKDKNVLVVGCASSGAQIACDLFGSAKNVYAISSSNYWILKNMMRNHNQDCKNTIAPFDLLWIPKAKDKPAPPSKQKNFGTNKFFSMLTQNNDGSDGIKNSEEDFEKPFKIVCLQNFREYIKDGKIAYSRTKIKSFKGKTVFFEDGSDKEIDTIIACTGYNLTLDFLDKSIREDIDFDEKDQFLPLMLHKMTFHPKVPNMAFVGVYRGLYIGAIEIFARWIMMTFASKIKWPSPEQMKESLEGEKVLKSMNPQPQYPHDDLDYMIDTIAKEIGVYPTSDDPEMQELIKKSPGRISLYRISGEDCKPEIAKKCIMKAIELIS